MKIKFLSQKITQLINIFLPNLCPSCKDFTVSGQGVCHSCAAQLSYIGNNHCKICTLPFDLAVGNDMECGECLKSPPFFDKIYAPFLYDGTIIKLILQFKHHDALFLAPTLSNFLKSTLDNHNIQADLILPVPLHYKKLLKRKYNQSQILATYIASYIKKPLKASMLTRIKDGSQKGKNKSERQHNVRNSFALSNKKALMGKTILLVDDVITTGATVNEIARILKKNGAKKVLVISLARVSFNGHNHIDF